MLEKMTFHGVGPAETFELELSPRMNFLTGDNGLGKTFLLDAAWWGLTRTWAHDLLFPHPPPTEPEMRFVFDGKKSPVERVSTFDRQTEQWSTPAGRPPIPGLVLYAQLDGGFSVWDPARNYWKDDVLPNRPTSYLFSSEEVWQGNSYCEGLIRDWASWQLEQGRAFEQLERVLEVLSPSEQERLRPGSLRKISVADPKKYPTLIMPYGQEVPVTHASAGMRRVIALAYLLVWTWQEHLAACELRGEEPTREIIFIIDEVEAHLHPRWQRRIIPALLDVMEALTDTEDIPTQLLGATHSPLVLASLETLFDPTRDAIFTLDLEEGQVELGRYPWNRRGDANSWLTSEIFDLVHPRSLQAERALEDALELLRRDDAPDMSELTSADAALRAALPSMDPFWVRWSHFMDKERQRGGS